MKNITETQVFETAEQVAQQAMQLVLQHAGQAIKSKGSFTLCLAGGSTPKRLYQLLAEQDVDYSNWVLLYGDERCLAAGDAERNSSMVLVNWLAKVGFPESQHFIMPAEKGAEQGAAEYQALIGHALPIDLCLLGMGEDGHTASLFPGHPDQQDNVIAVHNSPKPPPDRVSLNYSLINQSSVVCMLVTGTGKKPALQQWQEGMDLPVARVHGQTSTVLLLDKAAAQ